MVSLSNVAMKLEMELEFNVSNYILGARAARSQLYFCKVPVKKRKNIYIPKTTEKRRV